MMIIIIVNSNDNIQQNDTTNKDNLCNFDVEVTKQTDDDPHLDHEVPQPVESAVPSHTNTQDVPKLEMLSNTKQITVMIGL